jgi:hypothetical protein
MRVSKSISLPIYLIIVISVPCKLLYSQEQNISIREAKAAFNHFELKKSMAIYAKVITSKTDDKKDMTMQRVVKI